MAKDNTVQVLLGVSDFCVSKKVENSRTRFQTEAGVILPSIQSVDSPSFTRKEMKVPGDNRIIYNSSQVESARQTVTFAYLSLEDLGLITGGKWTEQTKQLVESDLDEAPEFATSYIADLSEGRKRLYQYFCSKVVEVSQTIQGRVDNTDGAPIAVTFEHIPIQYNGDIRRMKDYPKDDMSYKAEQTQAYTLPETPEGGGEGA
ncbi:MAG: hypothetical protein GX786_10780 [Clostridiales bacterium]|nr:hypothetical protein [Clostridiales bacterium]